MNNAVNTLKQEIQSGRISVADAIYKLECEGARNYEAGKDPVAFREAYLAPICELEDVQKYARKLCPGLYAEAFADCERGDADEWAAYEVLSEDI